MDAAVVRRIWDEVLTMVKRRSQRAAAVVREATVREVEGDTIVLLFKHGFHAQALAAAPELLQEALYEVLGGRWKIRCELSGQQGAVVADIPGRPATDDGGGRPDAAATTAPQPRGSASTTGHSAPAPTTSATGPGAAGPTASANGPSVAGPTASAASASPATASAPSRSASAPTTPANSPTVLAFSTTGPSAAVPIASMSAPTVRAATMTAAGTAPGRGPGPATPSDAAAFPDTGGGVAVAIADDDEWPEIAQIGLEADPDEDTPAAALHAPGAASIHTPTATQSPTHVPQTQGGGLKAPAAPRTPPGPKTKTQTQTTQTRTQPPPPTTRPAPGQGRAAARAAAAAAAAHKAPPKSARPGDDVWAGTTGEEPPFDPEFDATRPGFDPGDEPVDDLDDAAARLTTEQQALDLLREHLGAEKIGEIETK